MSPLRLYPTPDDARPAILRRDAADDRPLPASVRARMRDIFGEDLDPESAVARVLADVRSRGDEALVDWTSRIDGVTLDSFAIPAGDFDSALGRLSPDLTDSLRLAAERIRAFHSLQPLPSWTTHTMGGSLGQTMTPLDRVGVYVPGGTAPLPSTLLMTAIPARVAGVREIVAVTPPGRPDGRVPDVILAAAKVAGIETVYRLGGAQAIAALAYGTRSIPRVDKIVGPGNLFVTLAKRQVFGAVGLDGLAGPTETVVVADDGADPAWVAADLLAQAEHDVLATAILFTPSPRLAEAVQVEVGRQLESLSRAEIAAASLSTRGGIVLTRDVEEAVALADEFAPEHLCLSVDHPEQWAPRIRHAGGLFIGERSFEVLGDYVAGPSHVMPTGGTARFASPLTAIDFVRITNVIALDESTSSQLGPHASRLALAEALDGHASAALKRSEVGSQKSESDLRPPTSDFNAAWSRLVRPDITGMDPYAPIVPFEVLSERLGRAPAEIVKLDANENPYGPSPMALEALAAAQFVHIYPDPESNALREALSKYVSLPKEHLLAGAGADELIDLVLRALIQPGDVVINCPPSFGMYPFSSAVNAARLVQVPRNGDFELDLPAIERAVSAEPRAKALFVCSPNNPDGGVIPDEALRRLLALPVLVVLDEAYVEFHGPSRIRWVLDYPNLAVLRTFSKLAGLAGLRVGYGAFPEWLMPHLWKIKQPYNVNVAATLAALASLEDVDRLKANVEKLVAERGRLLQALAEIPFLRPRPSRSNFILCQVLDRPAAELKRTLESEGILVRYFDKPGLRDRVRISVGKPEHTDALVASCWSLAAGDW